MTSRSPVPPALFLLHDVPPDELAAAHRTIRLARHVYQKTSEVMHGRYGALDLADALLSEWEGVVDHVETLSLCRRPAPVPVRSEGPLVAADGRAPDPALLGGGGSGSR